MTYTVEIIQHILSQRSPARSGIENRWPKGKAKVQGVLLNMGSSSFRAYLNHFAELELLSDGEKIN